jgi:hypothetical protein
MVHWTLNKKFQFKFKFSALQTRAKYLSVAKSMKLYEDTKYEMWKENVEQILPSLLKRNLLIKPSHTLQAQGLQGPLPDNGDGDVGE